MPVVVEDPVFGTIMKNPVPAPFLMPVFVSAAPGEVTKGLQIVGQLPTVVPAVL